MCTVWKSIHDIGLKQHILHAAPRTLDTCTITFGYKNWFSSCVIFDFTLGFSQDSVVSLASGALHDKLIRESGGVEL